MFHLAELYNLQTFTIPPQPTPAQIGGYALALDPGFDSVMVDAGGMQLQIDLRGQVGKQSGNYWTPLGMVRIARMAWDSRLGPADGALTVEGGISFAPEFKEDGAWHRMADLSDRYRAEWRPEFVHPALVRGVLSWHPMVGKSGPTFETTLWITPDGVFNETRKTSTDAIEWGMTWPLLVSDGRPLRHEVTVSAARTAFVEGGDEENFLAIGRDPSIQIDGATARSTYGDLIPIRYVSGVGANATFVYPRNAGDVPATEVQKTMHRTEDGFESALGRAESSLYVGRTVAGGEGKVLRITRAGAPVLVFDRNCGFLARLDHGNVIAVETDRDVVVHAGKRTIALKAHQVNDIRRY
jgi:hypothetical protein